MKYLKKKKLYDLVKELSDITDIPKMKDCDYSACLGSEWLRFFTDSGHYIKVSCENCGKWVQIEEFFFEGGNSVQFSDIFAEVNPENGYEYHSHHEHIYS